MGWGDNRPLVRAGSAESEHDHAPTSSDLPDLGARTRDDHVEINDEMIAAEFMPRQATFALSSNGTLGRGGVGRASYRARFWDTSVVIESARAVDPSHSSSRGGVGPPGNGVRGAVED